MGPPRDYLLDNYRLFTPAARMSAKREGRVTILKIIGRPSTLVANNNNASTPNVSLNVHHIVEIVPINNSVFEADGPTGAEAATGAKPETPPIL